MIVPAPMDKFDDRLLSSVVEVADQGIAILYPKDDPTGPRIVYVNDSFCRLYGVDHEDVIGGTVEAFGIVQRHSAIVTDMMQHIYENELFDGEPPPSGSTTPSSSSTCILFRSAILTARRTGSRIFATSPRARTSW
jgi:PAS domain-containing protein